MISMNLRDIRNPQYEAVTGRRRKVPYQAILSSMGPSIRADARQQSLDEIREKELLDAETRFNAETGLRREQMDIQADQAAKATMIQAGNVGISAAFIADRAGLINLKEIAGAVKTKLFGPTATPGAPGAGGLTVAEGVTVPADVGADLAGLGGITETTGAGASTPGVAPPAGGAGAGTSYMGVGQLNAGYGGYGAMLPAAASAYFGSQAGAYVGQKVGEAIDVGGEAERGFVGRVGGGAAAGFVVGGPPGAAVGAAVGLIDWGFHEGKGAVQDVIDVVRGKKCIIITACTSADSEEVNIAREYRDRYLSPEELRGYYMIAERIVPAIGRDRRVKRLVKRLLVDNLIAYGRHRLRGAAYPGAAAVIVTRLFIGLCRCAGATRREFVRCNGEIV